MKVPLEKRGMANAIIPLAAVLLLAATVPLAAKPRVIDNADLKYSVTVPGECRVEEGPGTFEAICSPDFDEAKSAELPAAAALLLEVDAERVPADAKSYGEAEFRAEIPEAVCGDSDPIKIKLTNLKESKDGGVSTFSANVACPEIKFLGLAERSAEVRYVISSGFRYRLMARALSSDKAAVKSAVDGFLQSFKSTAEGKP